MKLHPNHGGNSETRIFQSLKYTMPSFLLYCLLSAAAETYFFQPFYCNQLQSCCMFQSSVTLVEAAGTSHMLQAYMQGNFFYKT